MYAFPPFSLVGPMLQKVSQDRAEVIVIVPNWPTKAWFSLLISMIVEQPRCFKVTDNVLFLPYRKELIHPLANRLELLVCRLSGKLGLSRDFPQGWCRPLHTPKGTPHTGFTRDTLVNGKGFVYRETLILFKHL